MHFTLRASDISALCGRNTYRNRQTAIHDLVGAYVPRLRSPPVYRDVLWEIEELIRAGPVYTEAISSRELSPALCQNAEKEANRIFTSRCGPIPPNERRFLRNSCRTMYLKDRGVVMEVDVLRRLESEAGVHWVPSDRKRRFFTRTFVTPVVSYTINGSIDGFEGVGDHIDGLLEVKNRRERFHIHEHDIDQLMAYVILSGLDHGRLVQCVGNGGAIDANFVLSSAEAKLRWSQDIRPILDRTLAQCAVMIREAAEVASREWQPRYISHVVVPLPPPPSKRWAVDSLSEDSQANPSCTNSAQTVSSKSSAAITDTMTTI